MQQTLCGTPEYVPPEMLLQLPRRYEALYVDQWALGVLAYELVFGKTPFYVDEKKFAVDESRDERDQEGGGTLLNSSSVSKFDSRHLIFNKIREYKNYDSSSSAVVGPSAAALRGCACNAGATKHSISSPSTSTIDDFCSQLMQVAPEERVAMERTLEHPFLLLSDDLDGRQGGLLRQRPTVAQRCQMFQQTANTTSTAYF